MGIMPTKENNALAACPEIAARWDWEKNEKGPQEYTRSSGRKVWLTCPKCKQSTERTVASAVSKLGACRVCAGKVVVEGINDLASQRPEHAKEWSPRNALEASEVLFRGGAMSAWWVCPQGHEYYMSVYSRVITGNGCEECQGRMPTHPAPDRVAPTPPVNNIVDTAPDLLRFWSYKWNKIDPKMVSRGTSTRYWWVCPEGHYWKASPGSRWNAAKKVSHGCSRCARTSRISQGELDVLNYCKTLDPHAESNVGRIIPGAVVDIYLREKKMVIEYNGEYWHSDYIMLEKYKVNAYTYHHNRRERGAMEGVSVYYVWEDDWNHREEEVKAALERLILHGEESELLNKLTGSLDTVLMERVKHAGKKKVPAYVEKCNAMREEIEAAAADPNAMFTEYCEKIGVPRASLSRWLRDNNIEWVGRRKGRRNVGRKRVDLDELRSIAADSSISYARAAAMLEVPVSRVVNLCKWNNIEWNASVRSSSSAEKPPKAPGGKPRSRKRVVESHGEIIERYWDREKNDVDPATLSWNKEVLYWWRCSEGHSYEKTIEQRLRHGCPVCHGRLVQPGVNDFASVAGERLLSEWSPSNGRGPETYSRGSNARVWWRCSRGHEFSMEINRRLRRGDRCPYCSGKAIVSGENDLRSHCEREESFAHLLGEWGEGNPPMDSLPPRSGRVVAWCCSSCGHGWRTTVANRTAPAGATGCPACARRR